ncbi:hypothetical protein Plano_0961 [Planococcus sp. PAMC 21323]|nr:hypothetical protein Plano_0961 [Planococcus sp. PAMC 21323]
MLLLFGFREKIIGLTMANGNKDSVRYFVWGNFANDLSSAIYDK